MKSLNERFMGEFLALEKVCDDMFGAQNGVTEYINQLKARSDCEMEKSSWYNFYKRLVKCRNARNALVHPEDYVNIGETDIEFLNKLYQDILNRRDPLCKLPKLFTASFYVDGKCIAKVYFKQGTRRISEPAVPPKPGWVGKWENYTLGNEDIFVAAIYTPITHKASFYADNKLVTIVNFTEGTRQICEPAVPQKNGYKGKWENYTLGFKDIDVHAVYTSLTHQASFYVGNKLITTVPFTEGGSHFDEPAVPQIDGYYVRWEDYTLGDKDIIVKAVLTKKKEKNPTQPQNCFTSAQIERNKFWDCFDRYLAQQGDPFTVAHVKGDQNQAAGNINNPNPMAMQTICCAYRYQDKKVAVLVYINHKSDLFDFMYSQREEIENHLGYKVEWIPKGPRSDSVRIIQKVFPINKSYEKMVEEVFPYILDFIKVFEPYLKAFAD